MDAFYLDRFTNRRQQGGEFCTTLIVRGASGLAHTDGTHSAKAHREDSVEHNQPSRTAQGAAMHRAAHQLLDSPAVFADPLALTIVGREAEAALRNGSDLQALIQSAGLRAFIAVRSRFTEDCLAAARARGVRQYVLLGAGLDTFAYRADAQHLRVFEVDHPATQGWKRERLAEVGIAVPQSVVYTPVDFERETIPNGLAREGFDFSQPALFAWLGVVPYLTHDAVTATLSFIASLSRGSEVVFDYAEPPENQTDGQRANFDAMAERVAAAGEPFRTFFVPDVLTKEVSALGFSFVENLGADALNARYFRNRTDGLSLRGRGHLLHARV
jgi:methyltransferase (TIGR00027 family)